MKRLSSLGKGELQPPFLGLFQVIARKGNRCYVVKHLSTEVEEHMDVERLTPYVPDPSCTNEEAARHDDLDECMGIDTILQHRCNGNTKRRNNYAFQIRWTDQSISWATYLSVKDARPVKLYVMTNTCSSDCSTRDGEGGGGSVTGVLPPPSYSSSI